ncbi:hypothetical protein LXA43DRAFT_64341 [Ganoderma leucocontextum]|nr:hypothetical protein LXA43DRAFT_64341 [Ganoderma leucocontextum]
MVLRLTSHLLFQPSPAQLASQAETIADLTFQRNMLLVERAEDHARFEAERESWTRNANALLAKACVAQEPIVREQETQRYIYRLEDDNKAYRRRLSDTQTRMSTLENELARIRPLLTMQATVLRDSELWQSEALSGLAHNRLASFGKKLKGKERATAPPDTDAISVNGRTDKEAATSAVHFCASGPAPAYNTTWSIPPDKVAEAEG